MATRPKLTVIQGGTSDSWRGKLVGTGVLDEDGREYLKGGGDPPSGGGGGDMTPLWKLDIPRDVQMVKWGLPLLAALVGYFFLNYLGDVKDIRRDIASVQASSAAQAATSSAIQTTLGRIEDRLEQRDGDQSQGGAGAQAARPVHAGTGGGARR